MLLSESLVWALEEYDFSGVKVLCEKSICDNVANLFMEDFSNRWDDVLDNVEQEYGECDPIEVPIEIFKKDYGFFICVGALDVRYDDGDFYDLTYSYKALEAALKRMKKSFPQIEYEGYIGYPVSDIHAGEAVQWEMSTKNGSGLYDFVGELLGKIFSSEVYISDEDDAESSEFWETLAEQLECNEDFAETIETIYAYAKWISESDLVRAINTIIDIAEEYDEDIVDDLLELVNEIKQGGCVDEGDDSSDNLPDGYMEALEMFMMAESISGVTPKQGEVISSDGTFDIVIAKAESGDAEAKLTAGKYFIADHIESEYERAIQWIREAADMGIQEAIDYIEVNKEMFE